MKRKISYANWKTKLRSKECHEEVKYNDLINIFWSTLDNHAPLKQRKVRGNQALLRQKNWAKQLWEDLELRTNTINGHPERTS